MVSHSLNATAERSSCGCGVRHGRRLESAAFISSVHLKSRAVTARVYCVSYVALVKSVNVDLCVRVTAD